MKQDESGADISIPYALQRAYRNQWYYLIKKFQLEDFIFFCTLFNT